MCEIYVHMCTDGPWLTQVQDYNCSTLWQCESNTHSVETVLSILIFCRLVICGMILSPDAGQWQQPQLPVSHTITRANHRCTYSHSVPIQPFLRSSTLYYKIGFVFDDFVQLQANVSILSTFKVGYGIRRVGGRETQEGRDMEIYVYV